MEYLILCVLLTKYLSQIPYEYIILNLIELYIIENESPKSLWFQTEK